MHEHDYKSLAARVLNRLRGDKESATSEREINMNKWDWPSGVALYGVYRTHVQYNDPDALDYLVKWYDANLKRDDIHRDVNSVCPMLALTCLYTETRREDYVSHIVSWANWVMNEMPRTEFGGLQHATIWNKHYGQLWADTLFMCCLFLAKAGLALNRKEWVEEAKFQFILHIKYLQDKVSGLWFHGWTFDMRHNFARAYWARGNGWFTCASAELLEMLNYPADNDAALRYIAAALEDQALALWKYQHENGLFNTLIDVEECYCETSATAAIACGLMKAARLGALKDPRAIETGEKAAEAVIKKISPDGIVEGVSGGTGMGQTLNHYKQIPIVPAAYGQGLTFLMLVELMRNNK